MAEEDSQRRAQQEAHPEFRLTEYLNDRADDFRAHDYPPAKLKNANCRQIVPLELDGGKKQAN
jgi:hypothetical protein